MNNLAKEKSPYLLQHADNPVEWYPWCDDAFNRAKREDKPILLSIGYSSCHWCHVMERESFEDNETAELMNKYFINIKVDREERPDIDALYMSAVQTMTGQGGWPLNVFLDPEGVPFYGGTYFPTEDAYGLPSFNTILHEVEHAYRENKNHINEATSSIKGYLSHFQKMGKANDISSVPDESFNYIMQFFDNVNGGFGSGGAKFPYTMILEFLLMYYRRTGKKEALTIVEKTLRNMAMGGIYDQIGGGFHRYSVDERWKVPHFEKMLYDNALLIRIYTHVYQLTGEPLFRNVACETADYILREMTSLEGGFYSAQDADSAGIEGRFYLWEPEEIIGLLGREDGGIFNRYFSIDRPIRLEHGNLPSIDMERSKFAEKESIPLKRLDTLIEKGRRLLYGIREKRVKPGRDDKIITAWNGLMLSALSDAAGAFKREDYLDAAVKAADFLTNTLKDRRGRLLRYYKDGMSTISGYLEDYAIMARGLLSIFESTLEDRWLEESYRLSESMIDIFYDADSGLFYDRGRDQEQLIVKYRGSVDNDIPSGSSAAADLLIRLYYITAEERFRERAIGIISYTGSIREQPLSFGHLLCAIEVHLSGPFEVSVIEDKETEFIKEALDLIRDYYLPNRIIARSDNKRARFPQGKKSMERNAAIYICCNNVCYPPVADIEGLKSMLLSLLH